MYPMRLVGITLALLVLALSACELLRFTPSRSSTPNRDDDAAAEGEGEGDEGEGDADDGEGESDDPGEGEGEGEGEGDGDGEGEGEGEGDGEGEGEGDDGATCVSLTCEHGRCARGVDGREMCLCDAGYAGNITATQCVPAAGGPCADIQCGPLGTCAPAMFGGAGCTCVEGAMPYGRTCVDADKLTCTDRDGGRVPRGAIRCDATDDHLEVCHDGNGDGVLEWIFGAECAAPGSCAASCLGTPCPDQPCPVGTACVEEAHEEPLGVCVPTCDCSNCGNCSLDNGDGRWDDWQEQCGVDPNGAGPPTTACNLPCPNAGDGCIPYDPGICWPMEGCFSAAP